MKKTLSFLAKLLLYLLVIPFTVSLVALSPLFLDLPFVAVPIAMCGLTVLWYVLLRKRVDRVALWADAAYLAVLVLGFTGFMIAAGGNTDGAVFRRADWLMAPYFPADLLMLGAGAGEVLGAVILAQLTAVVMALVFQKKPVPRRVWVIGAGALAVLLAVNLAVYSQRPQKRFRYPDHNFEFMNGFSSTDFSEYHVTAEPGKLARLPEPAWLQIDDPEQMPVMDGAEACYPLYAAVAKAVYRGIEAVETGTEVIEPPYYNGRIVQFSNTAVGFSRLLDGDVDLFFGAKPSAEQLAEAEYRGMELTITPIGREAFVFFVEESNPVTELSSAQLRAIYSGEVTDWSEVGGARRRILAFQRPRNSGSQTMMEYFMSGVPLKEPLGYEVVGAMSQVIHYVAEYDGEAGAIGYTFRYFLTGLTGTEGVRMLAVDGIEPTPENIRSGAYPLATDVCLITRAGDPNPAVAQLIEFMLSEQGQYLVEHSGYSPIR